METGLVCKLERSLYELKQAAWQWNLKFKIKLQAYGFIQSAHDHGLFTMMTDLGQMSLLVYVNYILITRHSLCDIQAIKKYLHDLFTIEDIDEAHYFLGLEIARNSSSSYLTQTNYILDLAKDAASFSLTLCETHWSATLHAVKYLKGCLPKEGFVAPSHIKGVDQLADMFTKVLPLKSFCTMVFKLELVPLAPSPTCGGLLNIQMLIQVFIVRMTLHLMPPP
ncbi:UNVERIFIED_CONTAM: Copia protein [Sesamum latifolium]|uniref:Copia protein n=1 Tax=Sesamum latifolium TaxID=2727402 RepID=A0AAW2U5P2_9LAMI